jgi:dihydroneopterin aldolase
VIVEVHGLSVFGTHGVKAAERTIAQEFLFDLTLEVDEPAKDSIDAAVDYRTVRDVVLEVSEAKSYRLIETLAAAVADAILARFAVHSVDVRVRKPGIAWAEWAGATASRRRSS